MMRAHQCVSLFFVFIFFNCFGLTQLAHHYYGAHITAQEPWVNKVVVYNNGNTQQTFTITIRDSGGTLILEEDYEIPANSSRVLVLTSMAGYTPVAGELMLSPVEGTLVIGTDSEKVRPKLSFRYGSSPSLTEFFMEETLAWEYILPNPVLDHFTWTGLAVKNPYDTPLGIILNAYLGGQLVGQVGATIGPDTKYVNLSDWIWNKIAYSEFDQIRIYSSDNPFPPPMSITGNDAQDRHVFFNAAVTSTSPLQFEAGDLYAYDSIVKNLRFVPDGTFTQGSPPDEFCRVDNEEQFTHSLTRDLAVMETEITRQMWADLKALQPTLPSDPTNTTVYTPGMNNPVGNGSWYSYVLFANLLSIQQGYTPCYYTDASMTTPLDSSNYETDDVYCHFTASGYRLPTEGEWEFFCRAGTTGPFWIVEPLFDGSNCYNNSCVPGTLPTLEQAAVFCSHDVDETLAVGSRAPNPWNLYDVHGNVAERVWDWQDNTYPSGTVTDYSGPSTGTHRVVRGGSYRHVAWELRSASRYHPSVPGGNTSAWGFRLVRTIN